MDFRPTDGLNSNAYRHGPGSFSGSDAKWPHENICSYQIYSSLPQVAQNCYLWPWSDWLFPLPCCFLASFSHLGSVNFTSAYVRSYRFYYRVHQALIKRPQWDRWARIYPFWSFYNPHPSISWARRWGSQLFIGSFLSSSSLSVLAHGKVVCY